MEDIKEYMVKNVASVTLLAWHFSFWMILYPVSHLLEASYDIFKFIHLKFNVYGSKI